MHFQVFDGLDVFRGRHCGFLDVTPHVMRSTSNVLYVEFYSDHDTVAEGFRATYRHIGSKCRVRWGKTPMRGQTPMPFISISKGNIEEGFIEINMSECKTPYQQRVYL